MIDMREMYMQRIVKTSWDCAIFVDAFSHKNVIGVTFNEQYLLWPIPQTEIDANPKLVQNPGR